MDFSNYDPYSGTFSMTSGMELAWTGQESSNLEYSLFDYVTYGVAGAATSAAVGIANTAIAFGNLIGVADEGSYIDETAAVTSLWGGEAGAFYEEHKTGLDFAGLVAGSFVPGLAAIRLLRMAQTAGKIPVMAQLKTGLKNPDILLNSKALDEAKNSVLMSGIGGLKNPELRRAYAAGVGQQFMEAIAFDSAIVLTMNQNTMLNPDNLSYLEAAKEVAIESLPFTFFGGAIGGGLEVLRAKGAVSKFVSEKHASTGYLLDTGMRGLTGMTPGDALVLLAKNAREHSLLKDSFDPVADPFAAKQYNAARNILQSKMLEQIKKTGISEPSILGHIEELVMGAGDDLDAVGHILSGLTKIDKIGTTDFKKLTAAFDNIRGPSAIISGESAEQIATRFADKHQDFAEVLEDNGLNAFGEYIPRMKLFDRTMQKTSMSSGSWTFGYVQIGESVQVASNTGRIARQPGQGIFIPDVIVINDAAMKDFYEYNAEIYKQKGMEFKLSLSEFKTATILHELGHVKNNKYKTLAALETLMKGADEGTPEATNVVDQLLAASIRARPASWKVTLGIGLSEAKLFAVAKQHLKDLGSAPDQVRYFLNNNELLADAYQYVTNVATRQEAAKDMPDLAKWLQGENGIARAWEDTKVFYNTRTKQSSAAVLPGINDLSLTPKYRANKVGEILQVPELNRTFTYNAESWNLLKNVQKGGDATLDALEYDAMWNMASRRNLDDLLSENNKSVVNLAPRDLPAIEKFATWEHLKDFADSGRLQIDGKTVSAFEVRDHLVRTKISMRDEIITSQTSQYYNEYHIAQILNTDIDFAMGNNAGKAILFGEKNFSRPENIVMQYKHKTPEEYSGDAIALEATMMRDQLVGSIRENAAARLLEDNYDLFPDAPIEELYVINPLETRSGLFATLRTEFRGFRETAQYIGKQVDGITRNLAKKVADDYAYDVSLFNRPENVHLRQELAQVHNLLQRNWYYLATVGNKKYLVDKKAVTQAIGREMAESGAEEVPDITPEVVKEFLDNASPDFIAAISGPSRADPYVVDLSKEVGEFYTRHVNTNYTRIVPKKKELAYARGKEAVLDPLAVYAPPRDLRQEKFHAFVLPTDALAGSDPRRFMIYGATEQEFNAKLSLIQQKYQGQYRVITRNEVKEYKQVLKNFDPDEFFNELHFDSSLARLGRASELFPNLDVQSSSTLDRYRSWTLKQEEALIRGGVELRYDAEITTLRALDKELSKVSQTPLGGVPKEQDSIWKDTVDVMLNKKSYGGSAEDLFVRINDFIGNAGSKVLDNSWAMLRPGSGKTKITEEQMKEWNSKLEAAGIAAPTRSAVEAIVTSPLVENERTLPLLSRTLSALTSTLMLRMDPAHSMIQLMSTPILGLPVLQELKQSLRGERLRQLQNMTSVVNPANGVSEPTAAKLLFEATAKFFSDEGKEFLGELRRRHIVTDYLTQYLDAMDFSTLNGTHTLQAISDKVDKLAAFASKFSGFNLAEELTRFQIAWSAKRIGEIGGLSVDELWPTISSAVDKVHGVYIGNQRPQLFQGVLGQAIGLYQTYFFNFAQNMMKFYSGGQNKQLLTLAGMQTSLFGVQSWTGFQYFNQLVGETNRGNIDLYNVTNADDPNSVAAYFMYGLGSHALGFPIDFYSRGDLTVRHPTVLPTNPWDFPVISTIAKASANIYETGKMLMPDSEVPISEAVLHGLAHNGMNRPMQGIANLIRDRVTTGSGQTTFRAGAFTSTDEGMEFHWGTIFARMIGSKPLNESIITNAYYRERAYDANYRRELIKLGREIKYTAESGELSTLSYKEFMEDYERMGGDLQSFNAYWMRQLQNANKAEMEEFYNEIMQNKAYKRMQIRQQITPAPWELP